MLSLCDYLGNLTYALTGRNFNPLMAMAADTVLVSAEEIISEDEIRRQSDRTVIPGFAVDALVHVPYGSFPHECYGLYEADFDHFESYTAAINAQGSPAVTEYLDRYVYAPAGFVDYLDLFGPDRLRRQHALARELT